QDIKPMIKKAKEKIELEISVYEVKCERIINSEMGHEQVIDTLIKNALENIDEGQPNWTYVASRIYLTNLYEQAANNRGYDVKNQYGSLYDLIRSEEHTSELQSHFEL